MPNMDKTVEVARRTFPLIFALDNSGSMSGERIAAVNEAMNEVVPVLKEISDENADAEIRIGALTFNSSAEWVTKSLMFLDHYFWNPITAGGATEVAEALSALDEKMSRKALFQDDTGNGFMLPTIIFMSDGAPTDNGTWQKRLEKIKNENKWFRYATKIAIAIGDDADRNCLAELVGSPEFVIGVNDAATLKKLIKVLSATASKIGSTSRFTSGDDDRKQIMQTLCNEVDNIDVVQTTGTTTDTDNGGFPDDEDFKDWK